MIDTLIVISVFILFYFIIVRPLQKKYGYGSYNDVHSDVPDIFKNMEDPSNPLSRPRTTYKKW